MHYEKSDMKHKDDDGDDNNSHMLVSKGNTIPKVLSDFVNPLLFNAILRAHQLHSLLSNDMPSSDSETANLPLIST